MKKRPKVAIVYDWANQRGGAERIIDCLAKLYPGSDFFSSVYNRRLFGVDSRNFSHIYSSFINNLPGKPDRYLYYYWLLPLAFETFSFDTYDIVISLTSGPAKHIVTKNKTFHVCYCLTPPRILWERRLLPRFWQKMFPGFFYQRQLDVLAANRPDLLLATCKNVARRIRHYYRRQPEIVYPGVDLNKFSFNPKSKKESFYLLVSRLIEYKKIDLVITTFNRLGWPLKIVGRGRKEEKFRQIASTNIEFLGNVNDASLASLYQKAQAIIYPQEEDFGLVPLEAQACGTPVIAYTKGGAKETLVPGITGELFDWQSPECLLELLKSFCPEKYQPKKCVQQALKFSQNRFLKDFSGKVNKKWQQHQSHICTY